MESILARALEYTLKYWLKSFSRDQFKLQGRTVKLSNLDLDGNALHASAGLPPALNVTTARVEKLEIILPSVSNVQVEPIVVQIDRLDLVLEENDDIGEPSTPVSTSTPASTGKGGYGFADKIADGMTLEVRTVNLLIETHGGAQGRGGASWASPMASITIRNLLLYTTNESWKVVNLKEARDFSSDKEFIYVFKKLEWEHLSIDLLPHPDMFANFAKFEGGNKKDDDGAKRVFFGGERFIEGISGEAYITIQRTDLNSPLGLEVQLHITEAVCPALSEPGLRALLRFFTGFYVCLNRGDVNPSAQQGFADAAGRSIVSLIVDHIFVRVKDAEFQLELLMQSLFFSRASVSDGEKAKCLNRVTIGGFFLRDTFSHPPCTLVQPFMQNAPIDISHTPDFAENVIPPIYPLGDDHWKLNCSVPLISLHCLQLQPSPSPPVFASRAVIYCQPLMIHLQEESCLRITSFLADGIVVNPDSVLPPDFSINSFSFKLKGLDVTIPLEMEKPDRSLTSCNMPLQSSFAGATLHIEDLMFSESPSLKLSLLSLEKDPACFCLWENQPIDASQKKLTAGASLISLSLLTCNHLTNKDKSGVDSGLWRCVEMKELCLEVAMVTADGSPLTSIPPPGGVVRVGVACQQYLSNTSAEQLFFVLDLYTYFGTVSEKIATAGTNKNLKKTMSFAGNILEKVPADTAVTLAVKDLQLRFLEPSSSDAQGIPLVCFTGDDLFIKVSHRTFGGAMAISSSLRWERVEVDCSDTVNDFRDSNVTNLTHSKNCSDQLRAVFWVQNSRIYQSGHYTVVPFLDISMVHVIPYNPQDNECHSLSVSACIAGIRLGGGMSHAESLLHRFGILSPDGGPGKGLTRGLKHLSGGPLSKLFKTSPPGIDELRENGSSMDGKGNRLLYVDAADDVDISIELKDWLFSLEGTEGMANILSEDCQREERSWHTAFQNVYVKVKSTPKDVPEADNLKSSGKQKPPSGLITVGMEGLKILQPMAQQGTLSNKDSNEEIQQNDLPETEKQIVLNKEEIQKNDLPETEKQIVLNKEEIQQNDLPETEKQIILNKEEIQQNDLPETEKQIVLNGGSNEEIMQNDLSETEKQIVDRHSGVNMADDILINEEENNDKMAKLVAENLTFSANKPNEDSNEEILDNGLPETEKQNVERHSGVNMAVDILITEDEDDDKMAKLVAENLTFSVNEPIEVVVKKDELQHLAFLCKSEVESMGRIAAGFLRILKLEGSVGSAAITQLSNLGSEMVFSPTKLSRVGSPFNVGGGSLISGVESTVASLEDAVLDSRKKCGDLAMELGRSELSRECLDNVRQLNEKLESMQKLVDQLRGQF